MYSDLREFLSELEKVGELVWVKEEITEGHEVFSIIWELGRKKGPAVILENVKGVQCSHRNKYFWDPRSVRHVLRVSAWPECKGVPRSVHDAVGPEQVAETEAGEYSKRVGVGCTLSWQ
jgi:3-polyprenyl-4-hydroxybenzoate decarboxylase